MSVWTQLKKSCCVDLSTGWWFLYIIILTPILASLYISLPYPIVNVFDNLHNVLLFQGMPWWRRFWGLRYQFRSGPELLPVLSSRVVKALGARVGFDLCEVCRYHCHSGVPGSIPGQSTNYSTVWDKQRSPIHLLFRLPNWFLYHHYHFECQCIWQLTQRVDVPGNAMMT